MNIYKELAKVFDAVASVNGKKENITWLTSKTGKHYAVNENGERVIGDPRATGGSKNINKARSQEKVHRTFRAEGPAYKDDEGRNINPKEKLYGKNKIVKKSEQEIYKNMEPALKKVYEKAVNDEENNTKYFENVAKQYNMKMLGENAALKQPGSFERKVNSDLAESEDKNVTKEEIAKNIYDLNRYTLASGPNDLVEKSNKVLKDLKSKGYKIVKAKNYWNVPDESNYYNGFNCSLISPEGNKLELQFHTLQSFAMKEFKTHPFYEIERNKKLTDEERENARKTAYDLVFNAKRQGQLNVPKNYTEFAKNI